MKKTKEQKGITLIALIITIVVLLVLAIVTINAIKGDGILKYAQKAASDYEKAQSDEEAILQNYLETIENNNNPNKETLLNHSGIIPEGATYTHYVNGRCDSIDDLWGWVYDEMSTYSTDEKFPEVGDGDVYTYGNYEYCYGYNWCIDCEKWSHLCGCEYGTDGRMGCSLLK